MTWSHDVLSTLLIIVIEIYGDCLMLEKAVRAVNGLGLRTVL